MGLLAWTSQAAYREKQDWIGQLLLCNNHTRTFLFIIIRLLLNLQDLSSLTRDWTQGQGSKSTRVLPAGPLGNSPRQMCLVTAPKAQLETGGRRQAERWNSAECALPAPGTGRWAWGPLPSSRWANHRVPVSRPPRGHTGWGANRSPLKAQTRPEVLASAL